MSRRFALLAIVVAALLISTGLVAHRRGLRPSIGSPNIAAAPTSSATGAVASPGVRGASRTAAAKTAARRPVARMVLPPGDAPLAPDMPTLVRAARAGDVGAMCRLSFELNRCGPGLRRMRKSQESLMEMARTNTESPNEWLVKSLAENAEKMANLDRVCAGVTPQPGLEPWRLLLDAAQAGHVPSMIRFAAQPPLDRINFLKDTDGWRAYAANAAGLLQRAADGGDPLAVAYLYASYRGRSVMNQLELREDDPQRALAYNLVLHEISDAPSRAKLEKTEPGLRAKLTADQQRAAEREAARLRPHFAERGTGLNFEKPLPETSDECEQAPGA